MISDFRQTPLVARAIRSPLGRGLGVLLVVTVSGTALAQPADVAARAAARELATQGAEAFERGDYAAAHELLTRANTLHPAPSISILQARSLVHLGRFVEALERYEEILRTPLSDEAPEAYRTAARSAATESEGLKLRIPHLAIKVRRRGVAPHDVTVLLDGKPLPNVLLDVEFPADPGEHRIEVRTPGFDRVQRRVQLAEQERVVLEISLDDAALPRYEQPVSSDLHDAGSPHQDSALQWRPILGWVSVGGAGVALAISALTGKVALDKKSHLDSVCDPGCAPEHASDIDAFRSYRTTSYVTGAASVVLAGLGGYLLLSEPNEETRIGLRITGSGASLSGTF